MRGWGRGGNVKLWELVRIELLNSYGSSGGYAAFEFKKIVRVSSIVLKLAEWPQEFFCRMEKLKQAWGAWIDSVC